MSNGIFDGAAIQRAGHIKHPAPAISYQHNVADICIRPDPGCRGQGFAQTTLHREIPRCIHSGRRVRICAPLIEQDVA